MVRALRNGLVLSFELSILILLLFLRVVELGESLVVALRTWSDKELSFVRSFSFYRFYPLPRCPRSVC